MGDKIELPRHSVLLREWLGDRRQEEGAELLGIAQQTLSKVLAGADAGLRVRILCKQHAGVPLGAWPPDELGITDVEIGGSGDAA